ncbi:MAG: serine--tRNA ligase [Prevotellaceae bacterium]|jgi:seryl-tRNA synthetase|nr:serine--tRNA ligase [Prevotellaceae bacterium]
MLTIKVIREQAQEVCSRLSVKNFDAATLVQQVVNLDDHRRALQTKMDTAQSEQNNAAKQIGALLQQGKRKEAEEAKLATATAKERIKEWDTELQAITQQLNQTLVLIPNIPSQLVPVGKGAQENQVIREGGTVFEKENSLPHWELADKYQLIDFDLGVKITGAGFPLYKGKGARLQRALISYFLDFNCGAGYMEIQPPLLINEASGFGTGQLPDKEGQMYYVGLDNFYLIPTAEVPVTNMYRDMILEAKELPIKLTAYTPCFRREAGSYGKEVRGLNRLHQFDKVEIVQICKPDDSYMALDLMVEHVEKMIQSLGLPYRILRLCGGDMGFASALTYDFEVWSAAQGMWLEVSSVSNFETFQSNRLKLRYRDEKSKTQLLHTLNGSALAIPRIVAALLENNQDDKGIDIPKVLYPYTDFTRIE